MKIVKWMEILLFLIVCYGCSDFKDQVAFLENRIEDNQNTISELERQIRESDSQIKLLTDRLNNKNEELLSMAKIFVNNPLDFAVMENPEEVEPVSGKPKDIIIDDRKKEVIGKYEFGKKIKFIYDGYNVSFTEIGGGLYTILNISTSKLRLKNGITVGVSRDALISMLGNPDKYGNNDNKITYESENNKYVLVFEISDNKIANIDVIENL